MKWNEGRQKTGYFKKTIYFLKLFGVELDCHLIKYSVGAYVPPHTDKLEGKAHQRLNIILKHAKSGGVFKKGGTSQSGRLHKFRPDLEEHEVTQVDQGTRLVLSFGLAK